MGHQSYRGQKSQIHFLHLGLVTGMERKEGQRKLVRQVVRGQRIKSWVLILALVVTSFVVYEFWSL
jgi:hypothetical protein